MFAQSVGMFGCWVCRYVQSKIDVGECRMLVPPPPTSNGEMPRGLPARGNKPVFYINSSCFLVCGDNKSKVVTLIVAMLSIMMTNTGQAAPGAAADQCSQLRAGTGARARAPSRSGLSQNSSGSSKLARIVQEHRRMYPSAGVKFKTSWANVEENKSICCDKLGFCVTCGP